VNIGGDKRSITVVVVVVVIIIIIIIINRLCGLVVRVPGYRSGGPGSIPGAARFSEKLWVWNGVHAAS
jgi:hypothetical protein